MRPGMTDLPFRSMMRVAGAACAATAASSPTATIRSPAMAIAWAIEKLASTVITLALLRMNSAGCAVENGGDDGADADVCAGAGKPEPKVNAVLAVTFRKSRRGTRSSVIRPSLALSKRCYACWIEVSATWLATEMTDRGQNAERLRQSKCFPVFSR